MSIRDVKHSSRIFSCNRIKQLQLTCPLSIPDLYDRCSKQRFTISMSPRGLRAVFHYLCICCVTIPPPIGEQSVYCRYMLSTLVYPSVTPFTCHAFIIRKVEFKRTGGKRWSWCTYISTVVIYLNTPLRKWTRDVILVYVDYHPVPIRIVNELFMFT